MTHHDRWEGGNPSGYRRGEIPLAARVIHLADRLSVLIRGEEHINNQRDGILLALRDPDGSHFDQDLVAVLHDQARKESVWLDIASPGVADRLEEFWDGRGVTTGISRELTQLTGIFAAIVDSKTKFTCGHSRGVAAVASFLAGKLGFGERDRLLMQMAGFRHDPGKFSVPGHILEKTASLTASEFNIIKQHTYFTYHILNSIDGLFPVAEWRARPNSNPSLMRLSRKPCNNERTGRR